MLPTPSTVHVNYEHVYEPAEDSYLLLDTLSSASETRFMRHHFPVTSPSPLLVEVGTGSGVVLAFATAQARHILGRNDILTLGVDVNNFACRATADTVQRAKAENLADGGAFLDALQSDLTASLRDGAIDILIFNPPYVPTEDLPALPAPNPIDFDSDRKLSSDAAFQRDSHLLALSYAGGRDGMETTNRLLEQLPATLSSRGIAYILLCAQNKPDEVTDRIRSWPGGWSAEKVGVSGKTAGWERLCILRIWRTTREGSEVQSAPC